MASLWENTAQPISFPPLEGDRQVDVLIIGGGMAGVLCAHCLTAAGVDCLLVEADRIGGGITQRTTAKITSQHGLIYSTLVRRFGPEKTRLYLDANEDAIRKYRTLCNRIPCDFTERDSYVYSVDNRAAIDRELEALQRIGFPAQGVEHTALPFPVAGAVKFAHQAQFHPLRFLYGIAAALPIHEHTTVRELIGTTAVTDSGRINARKIIVATHFPFLNKHGSYFLKMYQQRSYVLALEDAAEMDGMYVDGSGDGLSFRNEGRLLLVGGGGHRTGKQQGGWAEVEDFAALVYPTAPIRYRWAAQDCMTLDGVPYIGNYSAGTPDLYVATGFNKWGMTTSMVAAAILTDMVQEKENPYKAVFSPSRSILRPQLFVNAAEAVINLLTPTPRRCPHLGCALRWNPAEHTWDCPCHGSRFDEAGHRLNGPATGDLPDKP